MHVTMMELYLIHLLDDMVCVSGIGVEGTGVLEWAALSSIPSQGFELATSRVCQKNY
jgi:hypothetical protein